MFIRLHGDECLFSNTRHPSFHVNVVVFHVFGSPALSLLSTRTSLPLLFVCVAWQGYTLKVVGDKVIGNGSFGVVFEAKIVETGETVRTLSFC